MDRVPESGLPIDAVYDDRKLTDFCPEEQPGHSGEYPFTRAMYRRTRVDTIECITGAVERCARKVKLKANPAIAQEQARKITKLRESRDTAAVGKGH
jgi:hypothetical protein